MPTEVLSASAGCRDDEAELFRRLLEEGDAEAALLLVFHVHADLLRALLARRLAHRVRTVLDPADLLQEIGLSLLQKGVPAEIRSPKQFRQYLLGIARNKSLWINRDYLDAERRSLLREVHEDLPEDKEPPARDRAVLDHIAEADLWERVMHGQPAKLRWLLMWLRKGYEIAEVAAAHGMSVNELLDYVQFRVENSRCS